MNAPGIAEDETVGAALGAARKTLAAAGVDSAALDARLLLGVVLGLDGWQVLARRDAPLTAEARSSFETLVARRAAREPVARITGEREFWSLPIRLTPATLEPRPDSETLIEAAVAHRRERGRVTRILDLGTGSGCLLLAALSEFPNAQGIGLDISGEAVVAARQNAADLGLGGRAEFIAGTWDAAPMGPFDIVLANPPYIPAGAIDGLAPEVARHDPRIALDGGPDGLDAFRALAPVLASRLGPNGVAIVELGEGQAGPVLDIVAPLGLRAIERRRDLGGRERCLVVAGDI